jgi:hypothetical protein
MLSRVTDERPSHDDLAEVGANPPVSKRSLLLVALCGALAAVLIAAAAHFAGKRDANAPGGAAETSTAP